MGCPESEKMMVPLQKPEESLLTLVVLGLLIMYSQKIQLSLLK